MKIIVFGSRGMLGSTLVKKLLEAGYLPDTPVYRITRANDIPDLDGYDIVFNCLGAIPQKKSDFENMVWANTIVPRLMSKTCKKLVHFSTDCVFSGLHNMGKYNENDVDWSTDDYGWTKRNGEMLDNRKVLTIRTSIIGHRGPMGLLDWFLFGQHTVDMAGLSEVQGYTTHFWNGFTTNELSNILIANIDKIPCRWGLAQLGGECISKYDLLCKIHEIYKTSTVICPKPTTPRINKCLETTPAWAAIAVNSLQKQVQEMREDEIRWFGKV